MAEPAGKAIQEEFHTQYLVVAVKKNAVNDPEMTVRFREVLASIVPTVIYWFRQETETTTELMEDGVLTPSPVEERRRYLSQVTSFIDDQFDRSFASDGTETGALLTGMDWEEWDEQCFERRVTEQTKTLSTRSGSGDGHRSRAGMTETDNDHEVACPHCRSTDTRRTSLFAAEEMTMHTIASRITHLSNASSGSKTPEIRWTK